MSNVTMLEYKGRKIRIRYGWDKDLRESRYFAYIGKKLAMSTMGLSSFSTQVRAEQAARAIIDGEEK